MEASQHSAGHKSTDEAFNTKEGGRRRKELEKEGWRRKGQREGEERREGSKEGKGEGFLRTKIL